MKIMIIGHSGAGKSTLAKQLACHYSISYLYLDKVAFRENWQLRDGQEIKQEILTFLDEQSDWVIEGVYSKYAFQERLEAADEIIYLNLNRISSFYRILKRYFHYRGKNRESTAEGCKEKLNLSFLYFALVKSRRPARQKMYKSICQTYKDKLILLRSQKEIDRYLKSLP